MGAQESDVRAVQALPTLECKTNADRKCAKASQRSDVLAAPLLQNGRGAPLIPLEEERHQLGTHLLLTHPHAANRLARSRQVRYQDRGLPFRDEQIRKILAEKGLRRVVASPASRGVPLEETARLTPSLLQRDNRQGSDARQLH